MSNRDFSMGLSVPCIAVFLAARLSAEESGFNTTSESFDGVACLDSSPSGLSNFMERVSGRVLIIGLVKRFLLQNTFFSASRSTFSWDPDFWSFFSAELDLAGNAALAKPPNLKTGGGLESVIGFYSSDNLLRPPESVKAPRLTGCDPSSSLSLY